MLACKELMYDICDEWKSSSLYETGCGAQWLYRAYPVLVDGTYHMEMHGGREFEVIKLGEERVPVRVFAHMLVHYINHGCSHLHHPFKDNPVHRAMQWNSNPPGYEGGVRRTAWTRATFKSNAHLAPARLRCAIALPQLGGGIGSAQWRALGVRS